MPLLHLETRPEAWDRWFNTHDVLATGSTGMILDLRGNGGGLVELGSAPTTVDAVADSRETEEGVRAGLGDRLGRGDIPLKEQL